MPGQSYRQGQAANELPFRWIGKVFNRFVSHFCRASNPNHQSCRTDPVGYIPTAPTIIKKPNNLSRARDRRDNRVKFESPIQTDASPDSNFGPGTPGFWNGLQADVQRHGLHQRLTGPSGVWRSMAFHSWKAVNDPMAMFCPTEAVRTQKDTSHLGLHVLSFF